MELCCVCRVTRPPGVPDHGHHDSFLGPPGPAPRLKPGPSRVFDEDLKATYGSFCSLGRLTNAAKAYLQTLLPRQQEGTEELLQEAMEVSRLLSLLQRDVAHANKRAMAQVVTSQHHLWLAQSRLPAALQITFATLPITPGLTFRQGVDDILEWTDKGRRD